MLDLKIKNITKPQVDQILEMIDGGDFAKDYAIEAALQGGGKTNAKEKIEQHIETLVCALVELSDENMRFDLAEILREKINELKK